MPVNVFPVRIPCIAMASPRIMLRIFELGAQGLIIISGDGRCSSGHGRHEWMDNVRFVQCVLDIRDIEPERIELLEYDEGGRADIEKEVLRFAGNLRNKKPVCLGETCEDEKQCGMPALAAIIRSISGCPDKNRDITIREGAVPFGMLKINAEGCTGCGI